MLILSKFSGLYNQIMRGAEFIITDAEGQGKMEEEGIHNRRIYVCYRYKSWTGEIDSLHKIDLMIETIRKRRLEAFGVEAISSKEKCAKRFHPLMRQIKSWV